MSTRRRDTDVSSSIDTLIRNDHKILRECGEILRSENASVALKRKKLHEFIEVFSMHSRAEEKSLYDRLADLEPMRRHMFEGCQEHRIAGQLLQELKSVGFENRWNEEIGARVKILADFVEHHLREEESVVLAQLRSLLTKEELRDLGAEYIEYCNDYATIHQYRIHESPLPSSITASIL